MIYELISVLNATEKRVVTLQSRKGNSNNDSKSRNLFLLINKELSDNEIYERIGFKSKGEFAVYKNYLYQAILKILVNHRTNSIDSDILQFIKQVEFVSEKKLHKHALKMLSRGKIRALKYEKWTLLAELIRLEVDIHRALSYRQISDEGLNLLFAEIDDCFLKAANVNLYKKINSTVFKQISRLGYTKHNYSKQLFNNNFIKTYLTAEEKALSTSAKILLFHANATFHFSKGNYYEALISNIKLLTVLNNNSHFITEKPGQYITALVNSVINALQVHFYTVAQKYISVFQKHYQFQKYVDIETALLIQTLSIECYTESGNFKLLESTLQITEQLVFNSKLKTINTQHAITLHFAMANSYFELGLFKESRRKLNEILNLKEKVIRKDIYFFSKLLLCLIHFETDELELLESEVGSVVYYTKVSYKALPIERTIPKWLWKLYDVKSNVSVFKQLIATQEKRITVNDMENSVFIRNFKNWLITKNENISFGNLKKKQITPAVLQKEEAFFKKLEALKHQKPSRVTNFH